MRMFYKQEAGAKLVPDIVSSGAKLLFALVADILFRPPERKVPGARGQSARPRGFVNVPLKNARNFPH
jgi:hypothetical protein